MTNKLNSAGASHARSLISAGKVNKSSSWSFDAADGDKLLGDGGDNWTAYADAHLGIDEGAEDKTKARYKYPFEKDGELYRSAIVAIRSRASQQNDTSIFDEAGTLLESIDGDDGRSAEVTPERRIVIVEVEARADAEAGKRTLVGYPIVYNSQADIGGWFLEQIAPGAFDAAITGDVRALIDHDTGRVIGRTKSGTLRLSSDSKGVSCEIDLPNTTDGNDIWELVQRGDISGMSFSFVATKEEWDETGDPPQRTVLQAELYEVSAVAFPAYDDSEIKARAEKLVAEMRSKTAARTTDPALPVSRAATNLRTRLSMDLGLKVRTTR